MTREGTSKEAYVGRGGQMAVLAELLLRQINVAVPEIDEGEDVLAFVLREPEVIRIQVKTANAEALKEDGRYAARVSVPLTQVRTRTTVSFYYIFAIRIRYYWQDFLILPWGELHDRSNLGAGYVNRSAGELQLYFSFSQDALTCSGQDWSSFGNSWETLPFLARKRQG